MGVTGGRRRTLGEALARILSGPFRAYRAGSLYQELVRMVRGDASTAERLIALEKARSPASDRVVWIREAIRRLERDRR